MTSALATRFGRTRTELRSPEPLADDAIRGFAPTIFAGSAHTSRSARYTHIPTSLVLDGLRREGFQPFAIAQSRCRDAGKQPFTKHMVRLRHASQIEAREETQEIILINSHDGTSSYQMLTGCFRFVCANGMVVGDTTADVRVPHKGNVIDTVIEGAYGVLHAFNGVADDIDAMKALRLDFDEQRAFGRAALALRFDGVAPIPETRLIEARRPEDTANSLWHTFQRVQENAVRGGQVGSIPTADNRRRRVTTREVAGIDGNVKLNRALWVLATEMQRIKGG